jgi:hypothetical protein
MRGYGKQLYLCSNEGCLLKWPGDEVSLGEERIFDAFMRQHANSKY